jgi:acyl transferase domain-containing protein
MSVQKDANKFILELLKENKIDKAVAIHILKKLNVKKEDVAVIGIACRLPGANNPKEFWNILETGADCIRPFPEERRRDIDVFLSEEEAQLPDPYFIGGFLDEIDKFDAGFFNISKEDAEVMDPYQRLFLETAFEAIEDAGYSGDKIRGTRTGVYVGTDHTHKFRFSYLNDLVGNPDANAKMGSWSSILAGRVSNFLNLKGPSVVVDTGCSSGIYALHSACLAIQAKECDLAIAGGINLFLFPSLNNTIQDEGILKANETGVFDRGTLGTLTGEGIVALLLKPLSKAIEDNDSIYAVIKGVATNNNGSNSGLMEMSSESLAEVMTQSWRNAGLDPATVSYMETQGVATPLGDSIEVSALNSVLRASTDRKQFCALGSLKGSMGHLVGTTGLAAVLKVILAMQHKKLPPSINFKQPNSMIKFYNTAFYVNDQTRDWEQGEHPRRAGVNCYSFNGTNVHVVLEESPVKEQASTQEEPIELFTLSARKPEILRQLIRNYVRFLESDGKSYSLEDICYTANTGRGHYECRVAMLSTDAQDLLDKLNHLLIWGLESGSKLGIAYKEHRVAASRAAWSEGSLSESDIRQISRKANEKIKQYRDAALTEKPLLLQEILQYYVDGARISWADLYGKTTRRRVHLPVYPFERTRYWLDGKRLGR